MRQKSEKDEVKRKPKKKRKIRETRKKKKSKFFNLARCKSFRFKQHYQQQQIIFFRQNRRSTLLHHKTQAHDLTSSSSLILLSIADRFNLERQLHSWPNIFESNRSNRHLENTKVQRYDHDLLDEYQLRHLPQVHVSKWGRINGNK